jgi:hypothetical protein
MARHIKEAGSTPHIGFLLPPLFELALLNYQPGNSLQTINVYIIYYLIDICIFILKTIRVSACQRAFQSRIYPGLIGKECAVPWLGYLLIGISDGIQSLKQPGQKK